MQIFPPTPEKESSPYEYGQLNPQKGPDEEPNKSLLGKNTLGIEVTIKELAEKCGLGNIDPQHTEGLDKSALLYILEKYLRGEFALPERGSILVTLKPDADSVVSMALITLLLEGVKITEEMKRRIEFINKMDTATFGKWKPQPLPSSKNPWPNRDDVSGQELKEFAVISAISAAKVPLSERVELLMNWLQTGEVPETYRKSVEEERKNLINALERGEISIEVKEVNGVPIALVESTHYGASSLAYTQAPIIILRNPAYRFPNLEGTYVKYTIAQYERGWVDLEKVKEELNKLEAGWGGTPTIIGSPIGTSSKLETETIFNIVAKHLRKQEGKKTDNF